VTVRLQRYLAQAGIASRRKCEDLIAAGLVAVNGRVVTRPGTVVGPSDRVTYRGEIVEAEFGNGTRSVPQCLLFNKPVGVLTTRRDPGGGKTVYGLIPEPDRGRLIYVGRLDRDTEGVLLFTTDGELAHRLTHPRWGVTRIYRVDVSGDFELDRLAAGSERGLELDDGMTGPYRFRRLDPNRTDDHITIELELSEGRKREVRRMVAACGGHVERLVRTRYAFLTLSDLTAGQWRWLERSEVEELLALVDLGYGSENLMTGKNGS
jgi:23S rRNA pseudouridine2605 synthase